MCAAQLLADNLSGYLLTIYPVIFWQSIQLPADNLSSCGVVDRGLNMNKWVMGVAKNVDSDIFTEGGHWRGAESAPPALIFLDI